jgi:transcriptional regulator with PAS, ATPase and Fis domain
MQPEYMAINRNKDPLKSSAQGRIHSDGQIFPMKESHRKLQPSGNVVEIYPMAISKKISAVDDHFAFSSIVTQSEKMIRIMKEAKLHAASHIPVLITGETGTGKELLAKSIHKASARANRIYTAVNMSALTPTLFEAEFNGHTKGAFTGAVHDRKGYLETSSDGTLFLDEIGSLSLELQGKLLRVLQEGEYFKLGCSRSMVTNARFIAATNAELDKLQDHGLFRKDLFFRLSGAWIHLPPLRERREDIKLLVERFIVEYRGSHEVADIKDAAWDVLMTYDYPGNIRELKSIVQYAANLACGTSILPHHLPAYVSAATTSLKHSTVTRHCSNSIPSLAAVERNHILAAYRLAGENKLHTARILEIGLNTLRRKLKSYGIE